MATLEDFNRQACENELGLRVASDPPVGLNPSAAGFAPVPQLPSRFQSVNDISTQDLQSLTAFLKNLPAPVPIQPTDPNGLHMTNRTAIGPAENLYSDMLLHDMGETMRGPNTADPYIYGTDRGPCARP
jgi:hypothetical protein